MDFRIYYYECGSLRKVSHLYHKHKEFAEAKETAIKLMEANVSFRKTQFLIIEYTGPYESKIVDLIQPLPDE